MRNTNTHSEHPHFQRKRMRAHSRAQTFMHMHTQAETLWRTRTPCHFSCQSSHPEKPCPQIRSVYLCMCALSVLSVSYHWGGDASQGIILSDIWVCSLALSRKQGQSGQPQNGSLGFWCSFHRVRLSLMSPEWNWGTGGAPLTGSPAPALGHFVVCGFFPFNFWVNFVGDEYHKSMWQTHFLWIAHLHAACP